MCEAALERGPLLKSLRVVGRYGESNSAVCSVGRPDFEGGRSVADRVLTFGTRSNFRVFFKKKGRRVGVRSLNTKRAAPESGTAGVSDGTQLASDGLTRGRPSGQALQTVGKTLRSLKGCPKRLPRCDWN